MLFIGDDWAEDHHDIAVMDEAGRVLAQRRLTEGVAGLEALHDLLGGYLPEDAVPAEVLVGIETDRGPWVQGLLASARPSGPWPTGSSGSSTAASATTRPTTRTSRGTPQPKTLNYAPLDNLEPWGI